MPVKPWKVDYINHDVDAYKTATMVVRADSKRDALDEAKTILRSRGVRRFEIKSITEY
jgi:hypothetical protein